MKAAVLTVCSLRDRQFYAKQVVLKKTKNSC